MTPVIMVIFLYWAYFESERKGRDKGAVILVVTNHQSEQRLYIYMTALQLAKGSTPVSVDSKDRHVLAITVLLLTHQGCFRT